MVPLGDRPAIILLVEDNPDDQEMARRVLARGKMRNDLHLVSDGIEALEYLRREGPYEDPASSPRPDLILLDLNMPRLDGRGFLEEQKADPAIRGIPVIVLTTSEHEEDIARSYDLGCSSYVRKPVGREELARAIEGIEEYWFQIVVLPPRGE